LQEQSTEQLQDITLEDRYSSQHTVNPDLQALVNSPLPDSLAEFSTYAAQYTESPHTLPTQSPLPSPLTRHDSPSFTYPTPPASQEGLLTGSLPLLSPQEDPENCRQVSSPLSAAFYTTSMSSAAAVEEALNEVLPGESEADADLYGSGSPNPHSPLPSPLSATPAPSPLSSLPPSSVSSPGPVAFTGTSSFPVSPHHALQSQMMPNSEDPLLSSTPKDFNTSGRRRFEFQSYKLITSQNLVDFGLGNGSLAGIVVDNNGEFKLIQTAGLQKTNVLVQAGSLSPALAFKKEIRLATPKVEPITVNLGLNVQTANQQQCNSAGQFNQQQVVNPVKFLVQTNHTTKNNIWRTCFSAPAVYPPAVPCDTVGKGRAWTAANMPTVRILTRRGYGRPATAIGTAATRHRQFWTRLAPDQGCTLDCINMRETRISARTTLRGTTARRRGSTSARDIKPRYHRWSATEITEKTVRKRTIFYGIPA